MSSSDISDWLKIVASVKHSSVRSYAPTSAYKRSLKMITGEIYTLT
jgi:hypothetical protein